MTPQLYILRHGETLWNAENRMQGALNSPLTDRGRDQAARQRQILLTCDLQGFAFLSSPQGRAFQTAAIALAGIADVIRTDNRLREIDVGEWGGCLRDDLPMPAGPQPLVTQYDIAPGGEGLAGLKNRVRDFLAGLPGPSVLVTHGVTSMILRGMVTGETDYTAREMHGGQGCVYYLRDGVEKLLQ